MVYSGDGGRRKFSVDSGHDRRSLQRDLDLRSMLSTTNPSRWTALLGLWCSVLFAWAGAGWAAAQTSATQATTVPVLLPGGVAYDSNGTLYLADTGKHVLLKVTAAGVLTTLAGTGTQGFDGDGGPATAALLDSPTGVALDGSGNVYIADSHNHRIRRVDAVSGVITTFAGTGAARSSPDGITAAGAAIDLPAALALDSAGNLFFADSRAHLIRRIDHVSGLVTTVAGNGVQAYAGDGGPATAASLDAPEGLAVDSAGDLYLSDTHNQRVRRVDGKTGVITTVAGTGVAGFLGDAGAGTSAAVRLPRGLALDSLGNLLLVDSQNYRVRRLDAASGQMSTVAGDGTQAFAGDGGPAIAASLNAPRAVAVNVAGQPTLSDSGNARVRQVDASAVIHTLAGVGSTAAGVLTLTAPSVTGYGTGAVTATLAASPATGTVTFFDGGGQTLGAASLSANAAVFPLGGLGAGSHRLSATYTGDASHGAAQSGVTSLTIALAPLTATPNPVSLVYGQAIPGLTGTMTGELPRDAAAGSVALALVSTAHALSPPGSYPITASINGSAAANYTLTAAAAAVTIAKAPSVVMMTSGLAVQVASSTSGTATGTVALVEAGQVMQTMPLSPTGSAAFAMPSSTATASSVSGGTPTLTAVYSGDGNLLGSSSAPLALTASPAATPDFALAAAGSTAITATAGTAAVFSFTAAPVNGGLSSPIQLTVAGLPTGATASFSPAYLPPGSGAQTFTLTIQTPKTAGLRWRDGLIYACLLPAVLVARRRRVWLAILVTAIAGVGLGCGDRVNTASARATAAQSYTLTVSGTGTSAAGATVLHTVAVTLTVQ